ncbi:hypothetical protein K3495_g10031 [Podosphaera aphanis]|nr:hypothetical protein K3495_g10031 [Podosphaera aphanis]
MGKAWGDDTTVTNSASAPSYRVHVDDRRERTWRALVDVITKYPAVQEIFMDFNFENKVDLSTLANAPAEVRYILHELSGRINSHCVAQRNFAYSSKSNREEKRRGPKAVISIRKAKEGDLIPQKSIVCRSK